MKLGEREYLARRGDGAMGLYKCLMSLESELDPDDIPFIIKLYQNQEIKFEYVLELLGRIQKEYPRYRPEIDSAVSQIYDKS